MNKNNNNPFSFTDLKQCLGEVGLEPECEPLREWARRRESIDPVLVTLLTPEGAPNIPENNSSAAAAMCHAEITEKVRRVILKQDEQKNHRSKMMALLASFYAPDLLPGVIHQAVVNLKFWDFDSLALAIEYGTSRRAQVISWLSRQSSLEMTTTMPDKFIVCDRTYQYVGGSGQVSMTPRTASIAALMLDCEWSTRGNRLNIHRWMTLRSEGLVAQAVHGKVKFKFLSWMFPNDLPGSNLKVTASDVDCLYHVSYASCPNNKLIRFLDYLIAALRLVLRGFGYDASNQVFIDLKENGWDGDMRSMRKILRCLQLFINSGRQVRNHNNDNNNKNAFQIRLIDSAVSLLHFLSHYRETFGENALREEVEAAAVEIGQEQLLEILKTETGTKSSSHLIVPVVPESYRDPIAFPRDRNNQNELFSL